MMSVFDKNYENEVLLNIIIKHNRNLQYCKTVYVLDACNLQLQRQAKTK